MFLRVTATIAGLFAGTCFLMACGPGARPGDLVKVDRLMQDRGTKDQAATAAPQVFKESQRYYAKAEEAYEDGEAEECIYNATMAAVIYSTAVEHAKRLAAEDRKSKADERRTKAEKIKAEQGARLADAKKRITRMEKIIALAGKLDAEKKASAREKKRVAAELAKAKADAKAKLEAEQKAAAERLAAEQARAAELKQEKEVQELLAAAQSKIQVAESLEARTYDPMNLNSAKTYAQQTEKALKEKRYKDAKDLAKMAEQKAGLATAKAQAEYAKKKKETELLKERESLFNEAAAIGGMSVKKERRGVVMTLNDMFASRKAVVLPERTYLLDKIAELADKYKDYPIVVEGYTDSRGRDADNLALSQGRAQSVLDYLVQQKKLKFERIKSSGYGEAKPVADNSKADGRSKNRRVEVIFLFR